ncbi:hypothetical protein BRADI_3g23365v3 [Brachypodium distachyon]|uniref:Homeobox domain-containing protein n=1 Tax=Brachypodium distachyon TaxID=15368 RepID=A0A0Q3JDX2_BRADI|nr:hypothetical protein BRADI_3g23365v3 [Brachypodium distachyon]
MDSSALCRLFKECPHPDEKQRAELSMRLSLDARQVKFWFQNRRTQMKTQLERGTQLERHENALLKQENDKLYGSTYALRMHGSRMNSTESVPLPPSSLANLYSSYFEEYHFFLPGMGMKPAGFVFEASRESGLVIIDNSVALVETLMDERRWSDMFSCMIAKATILEEVSTGIAGSRNGSLLLMKAELQVLSPLVPIREVIFLMFCKQLAEGAWAVVDVSIDGLMRDQNSVLRNSNAYLRIFWTTLDNWRVLGISYAYLRRFQNSLD